MFDPTKPSLTPQQLAEKIGGEAWNTDHPLDVCLVLGADGSDVRCNVSAFDPKIFTLSPRTPIIPPNAPSDFVQDLTAAAPVTATAPAPSAPAAPVPPPVAPVPPAPPSYEGAPNVFTMPTFQPSAEQQAAGIKPQYFRSDAMGRRLNPGNFDTQELAAASPVTLDGPTGDALPA